MASSPSSILQIRLQWVQDLRNLIENEVRLPPMWRYRASVRRFEVTTFYRAAEYARQEQSSDEQPYFFTFILT
jgi:hypothetical protein